MIEQGHSVGTLARGDDLVQWDARRGLLAPSEDPGLSAEQVGGKVVPVEESRGADPRTPPVPPLHIRRSKEHLSQDRKGVVHDKHIGQRDLKHLGRLDHPLNRALDLVMHHLGGVELPASHDLPERRPDVVAVPKKKVRHLGDGLLGGILRDEEGPEFASDITGALGHRHNHVDDVIPRKHPRLAKEGLHPRVVILALQPEHPVPVGAVAREGPGSLLDVLLAVVPLPKGKKLHHLAGEVLVGMTFATLVEIKPFDHGGIPRDLLEHGGKLSEGVPPDGLVLLPHRVGIPHLGVAGREMTVPEERGLFHQRGRRVAHPVEPPHAQIQDLLAVCPVELLFERLALLLVRARLDPLIVGESCRRIREGRRGEQVAILIRIQKRGHGLLRSESQETIDLGRGSAETSPVQQVCGRVAGPTLFWKRGEHVLWINTVERGRLQQKSKNAPRPPLRGILR